MTCLINQTPTIIPSPPRIATVLSLVLDSTLPRFSDFSEPGANYDIVNACLKLLTRLPTASVAECISSVKGR